MHDECDGTGGGRGEVGTRARKRGGGGVGGGEEEERRWMRRRRRAGGRVGVDEKKGRGEEML